MRLRCILLVLAMVGMVQMCRVPSVQAANLTVKGGNGVYVVSGDGLTGAAAIDFNVTYDASALSGPVVSVQGTPFSGWLLVANTNVRGTIRVAMVSATAFSGSGPVTVATINFKGTSSRVPNATIITLADTEGRPLGSGVAPTSGGNLPSPSTTTTSTVTTTSSTSSQTTTQPTSVGGIGNLNVGGTTPSADTPAPKEAKQVDTAPPVPEPIQPPQPEAVEPEEEPHPVENKTTVASIPPENKYVVYKGVLDRFREFEGEKTPKKLIALFDAEIAPTVSQDPKITLSDGKTTVKVDVELSAGEKSAPNFALKGARLKSLKKEGENRWIVEALPEMNIFQATLTVMYGERVLEIPLTIAPPMKVKIGKGDKLTEADFALFLKERGNDKAPRFDLNGDGKRDYIDDFIFAANYLAAAGEKKSKSK